MHEVHSSPTPFAKWLGGKRKLAQRIISEFPESYNIYYEPFAGAGSVFLALQPDKAVIADVNTDLVDTYKILASDESEFESLLAALTYHKENHAEDYYYEVRALDRTPEYKDFSRVRRAARFLYLNKAGFNGVFRLNSSGYFNVPSGKRKDVNFDEPNLRKIFELLHQGNKTVTILNEGYEKTLETVVAGDVVYLDPPYDVLSPTASFTAYAAGGFSRANQEELYEYAKNLVERGAHVIISNAGTDFIKELYGRDELFTVNDLSVQRQVGARHKETAKSVGEVLAVSK